MNEETNDQSQKTERPTEHRITKAQEKGQIPVSREISHWLVLLTIACLVSWIFPILLDNLTHFQASLLANADYFPAHSSEWQTFSGYLYWEVIKSCALPFILLLIAGVLGGGVQTRFRITRENLRPHWHKLSLRKGIKRLFGQQAIIEFFKTFLKLSILFAISFAVIFPEIQQATRHAVRELSDLFQTIKRLSLQLLAWVLSIFAVLAILDYLYQRFMWLQKLKMTPQEIKEEQKETEGDPHIKGRLRQLRYERARRRVMAAVSQATVLITNPTHYAVALKYEPGGKMNAPVVVAKGADLVALAMREVAHKYEIPITENPPLAQALYRHVKEGQEIPVEYYEAVAQIIRYILRHQRSHKKE
jgi:flagellar biosynthetic protein FlhB